MNKIKIKKTVALISFYDRTCESTRILSSILKNAGHTTHLIFFKDDRAGVTDHFKKNNKYYQSIIGLDYFGTGEDINPSTETEIEIFVNKIKEIKPDVIGFSARSVSLEICELLVLRLREELPQIRYIGGGYGPTLEPERFLKFLDYVCIGEGYQAILDLVELESPEKTKNIYTLVNGKLQHNKLAKSFPVENNFPFPDWSNENKFIIEEDGIFPVEFFFDVKTYNIFASIGCPSSCTYCQACQLGRIYKMYDADHRYPKVKLRSPQDVINELMRAKRELDINLVRFMDSVFGFKKTWFYEFMDLYDKFINLDFMCFIDERWIDREMIQKLKESGLQRSVVGIQGTTEEIRKNILGRGIKDEGIIKFAETLDEYDISFKYDILHWNPFDTNESLSRGVKFLKKLPKGQQVDLFQLKVFPKSELAEKIEKEKPKFLSNEEYEYWGWIYQLILRSEETEEITDFVLRYNSFKDHPQVLKSILKEVSQKYRSKYKLFARVDIGINEIITGTKLVRKKSDSEEDIDADKINVVVGKHTRKKLIKGAPLSKDAVYGSYQDKVPFTGGV